MGLAIQPSKNVLLDRAFRLNIVNDVLQCPEIVGINCPKTDGFTVQNDGEAAPCFPQRFYKSTRYVSFFLR